METGKITITVAIITVMGTLGTALFANWDKLGNPGETHGSRSDIDKNINTKLKNTINKLELLQKELKNTQGENSHLKTLLRDNKKEIEELKHPFHQINNSKLKQLLSFHNDASCYGQSLNFTHIADKSYSHCVSKEVLAKRILKFFEELEIIKSNGGADYSRTKAKNELIKLQSQYQFTNPGWYTEYMLGILIIEYAKKS